jgi:solute carrier family 25 protein 14/30
MMATEGTEAPSFVKTAGDIYKGQGMGGFYRGIEANIMRAMVLNGTKMGVYDQIKGMIKKSEMIPVGIATDFSAAFCAGFFMSVTVSPFDMVRTQLMNQPADAKIYNNALDCAVKLFKKGGFMSFYAGFIPIWGRFAPTTCLQLVIFEQLKPIFGV